MGDAAFCKGSLWWRVCVCGWVSLGVVVVALWLCVACRGVSCGGVAVRCGALRFVACLGCERGGAAAQARALALAEQGMAPPL